MRKEIFILMIFVVSCSSVFASTITRYGSDFTIVEKEISFKVNDRLGTERLSFDYEYVGSGFNNLPYGQQLKNKDVKLGFNNKELDDTDNYYFNARYYDYDSGKFLGVDPINDNPAYAFVSNNPMNYIDPSGLIEKQPIDTGEIFNRNGLAYFIDLKVDSIGEEFINHMSDEILTIMNEEYKSEIPQENKRILYLAKYVDDTIWDSTNYAEERQKSGHYLDPYSPIKFLNPLGLGNFFSLIHSIERDIVEVVNEGVCVEKSILTVLILEDFIDKQELSDKYGVYYETVSAKTKRYFIDENYEEKTLRTEALFGHAYVVIEDFSSGKEYFLTKGKIYDSFEDFTEVVYMGNYGPVDVKNGHTIYYENSYERGEKQYLLQSEEWFLIKRVINNSI